MRGITASFLGFLILFTTVVLPAFSQENGTHVWSVLGIGQHSCGKWLIARENKDEIQIQFFLQWISGWTVAYNYYETENKRKRYASQPDFETITVLMDKFCSENPTLPVSLGAAEIVQKSNGTKALHNTTRAKSNERK